MRMINETNEQKPIIDYSKYSCNNDCDIKNGQCCHPDNCQKSAPPQEVEAKWTWNRPSLVNLASISRPDGTSFICAILSVDEAKLICDRFNELDRLRSSMGKVPSDEEIEKQALSDLKQEYISSRYDFEVGAKWMRSEVATVIAGLEKEKEELIKDVEAWRKASEHNGNEALKSESELKSAKVGEDRFWKLREETNELLAYLRIHQCIDEEEGRQIVSRVTALLTPNKE